MISNRETSGEAIRGASRPIWLIALALGVAVVALLMIGTAPSAHAGADWSEVDDAGDLPATAQLPIGGGALTSIGGALGSVNDVDMYQVCLTGGGNFSAHTVEVGGKEDTKLFLFDSAGLGVYANDDDNVTLLSLLPAFDTLTPVDPGVYYLAISSYNNFPESSDGAIFPLVGDQTDVEGPTGPGGGLPISGWLGGGETSGTYFIELTGAEFSTECGIPNIVKAPRLANLWLCDEGICDNKASGVAGVNLHVNLDRAVTSLDPKCVGFPNFLPPEECDTQQIGSFEFEVRFDAKYVTVEVTPGTIFTQGTCTNGIVLTGAAGLGCECNVNNLAGAAGLGCCNVLEFAGAAGLACEPPLDVECFTATGEGYIQFACVTKGKPLNASSGPGTLAIVHVRPTADVYKLLIPNQENGIVTELINQGCQLSDLQGHPIETDLCENAAITIRYLEGDVHADCVIDVLDQQQVAFRWGAQLGNLLYSPLYDLEPSFPKADGDIDAKDLQFVYGRHTDPTSTCKTPHPAQDPVDPQLKIGPTAPEPNG